MSVEFKHATLPNELTIIGEVDTSAHSSAVGFFVKTGARDEDSQIMGVSHFLEHMMFKGSETRAAEDVDRAFDDIGAEHNAFTTSEMTAFWAHSLPDQLHTATEVLADILRPALRKVDFDNEKKVIIEEIAMYEDHPFWVLYERAMEKYYRTHPLSHRVLGTRATIANLTRDQMAAYFSNRYSADNTVIALAGNFDFDAMVEYITSCCEKWKTTGTTRSFPDVQLTPDELKMTSDSVHRHYLLMIAPGPAMSNEMRYAASILSLILGDTEGSRLYWALIETGLADEAQAQYDGRDGVGEYLVYASCSPENAEAVEVTVRNQLNDLIDSITEDDLIRVRSKVATGLTVAGELPAGRMKRLGRLWSYNGEYRSLESELERINSVTISDLRDVHEAFPLQPMVIAQLSPATPFGQPVQGTPTPVTTAHGQ